MNIDFALILVLLTFISGIIWLIDSLFFASVRKSQVRINEPTGSEKNIAHTPVLVDYAKSFFPIFLLVLILRSFIVEPFRIPSASMMPTLLIGDFILVNKYEYGIRLPVINTKVIDGRHPERGDIVVFRYPEDTSIPFIKRIIGLPGDHINYYDKTLYINGKPMKQTVLGDYNAVGSGIVMNGASLRSEDLGTLSHQLLINHDRYSREVEGTVPEGYYFVLGDNRDNSKDSRYWGFVPDENLIGRAFMIWMNWDLKNGGIEWKRIGTILQ
jgi:signal peptidase I